VLEVFFKPRSVAVIGATREPGGLGYSVLKNIVSYGYSGPVYPINPKAAEIAGMRAYPSVLDVPDEVELGVIVTPARIVPAVVEQCGQKGCKGLIIISAGFREAGPEGLKAERLIGETAARYNMRVIGPNCLGVIDTTIGLNASFAAEMPQRGRTAFMSQSGALMAAIMDWTAEGGFGYSSMVSLGNKLDVDEIDLLEAWAADEETRVILGYLEGIANGERFMETARRVTRKKPVVLVKSGTTAAGSRAISSHTGTLAGSDQAYRAAFRQTGVIRANSVQDLFDYSFALANQPVPAGNSIALVTNAGGPGIMATDAAERLGLRLAGLSKATTDRLHEELPPHAGIYNPVDVLGDALADRYAMAMEVVLQDPGVHAVVVVLTPQIMTQPAETARAIVEVASRFDKPVLGCFMGARGVEEGISILNEGGIPNYTFPERAMEALFTMAQYGEWVRTPERTAPTLPDVDRAAVSQLFDSLRRAGNLNLGEVEARSVLQAYGIPVPQAELAGTPTEAANAASRIGFPIVMKIASPDILHKSDVGGVLVGLKSAEEVSESYHSMMARVRARVPDAEIRGVTINQLIPKGREVIIGMSRDPQFGPMLMFGLGGIYVEVLKDVTFRIAPVDEVEARNMMSELRSYQLLLGARGEPPADLPAALDTLLRVSQLVTDFPEILEMDINPLVLMPTGGGAIALDARMTLAPHGEDEEANGGDQPW
jgi:acetate---CoA ligase (ADP-forming)